VRPRHFILLACLTLLAFTCAEGQSPNGTVSGLVVDPTGAAIVGADVLIANDATSVQHSAKTNGDGIYLVSNLLPGTYRLQVSKIGFKTLIKPDIILNVQDALAINFTLPIGAVSETVTVTGGAPMLDTQDGAVSTIVDRQFAENLPLNGRSFQTLIQLTPGVVLVPSTSTDQGQFSMNGQRTSANYWMVDGVSANIGVGTNSNTGNAFGGAIGSFSVLGGTNSLVSVDAMQEFRIQTSTYAPEFGRTPGAQISIATRSGTNQFHGTAFDYLRNDVFDANDWFADKAGLPKPKEQQNDFGGTFSGPIRKDRTFFFFSYEGLRLQLPQTALTTVPDLTARQGAVPAMQPYLNAYPLPNAADDTATGVAQFNASYSNPATLDAYSLRIDHRISDRWSVFGRYNYSPSQIANRGVGGVDALSVLESSNITTQTLTLGATWDIFPTLTNDFRFNYSRTSGSGSLRLDNFGGAVPLSSLPFPAGYDAANGLFVLAVVSLEGNSLQDGKLAGNLQRQINVVDNLSWQKGSHTLKFGIDFRRLSPSYNPGLYSQQGYFLSVSSAETGGLLFSAVLSARSAALLFHNVGSFAQDTWRTTPRLTITYGLRWDLDFAPSATSGPGLPAVTGYNLSNLAALSLAPLGTRPFATTYGNFAPRLGVAYQISQNQDWETVLRGGFGVFYDLVTSEAGNDFSDCCYPFGASSLGFGGFFPLGVSAAAPPPIAVPSGGSGSVYAFDPNIKLPYTLEWNVSLEQALGKQQTVSASYIGSVGRRLLQTAVISSPNANYAEAQLIGNTATSDYNALQLQFQRRLAAGLQALASYTWSHSIDDGSSGSAGNYSSTAVPGINPNANRGPSDFDIRNAMSAGVTYDIPAPKVNALTEVLFRGWSLQSVIQARSAPPVDVYNSLLGEELLNASTLIRPDVVPGEPLYLYGPQYPGGKAINGAAFSNPPTGQQGNLGRNALRGFGAAQWDFAVHRDFPIREPIKLQFRAEMFNVLNHPNFGPPVGDLSQPNFGLSTQMLGQSLNYGNLGSGAFDPLYQIGGPRSIQLALKLMF